MTREIDADAFVRALSDAEARDMLATCIRDVGRLTAAIKDRYPLIMGAGDGAIDTAIRLVDECRCR